MSLSVNSHFADAFARAGLTDALAFLELPGEVVSGHPDRHVCRVQLPFGAFYLKRQHVVGWKERFRNWRAGFGWVSRCSREAEVLSELNERNLPAPRWAAFGEHDGRAFLLVEEVRGGRDLRTALSDSALSPLARRDLARRLGRSVAAVHAAGYGTPDLTAKHVLVKPNGAFAFLDWQNATRGPVSEAARADALGALHASLAVASRSDRARAICAYGPGVPPLYQVLRAAAKHAKRRSVRDQLQPRAGEQRLVWLAGEAVCAIPEVAAAWPTPAVAAPFYDSPPGAIRLQIAGREAVLVRGREFAPVGRFKAWLKATPYRSAGANVGRVLFHLERYGVPAPRLLAFGQRLTGAASCEWFALYEPAPGVPVARAEELVERLHEAGCELSDPRAALAVCGGEIRVVDPLAVRVARRGHARARTARAVAELVGAE